MMIRNSNRRSFLKKIGAAGAASVFLQSPELFAEQLTLTPSQTEGPYYPPTLPLDTDNDLVVINDAITPTTSVRDWPVCRDGSLHDWRHRRPIRHRAIQLSSSHTSDGHCQHDKRRSQSSVSFRR